MAEWLQSALSTIPEQLVYALVGLVIGFESLGIPLPGEVVLVTASLLSSKQELGIDPLWIAICGSTGAIIGDSIGYAIGRRYGQHLFNRLGQRWPGHFGPDQIEYGRHVFRQRGAWAVFFGRFVALLRIFAGPLAGALHMPYPRFLVANAAGGIVWAGGTTYAVYYVGIAAEHWLQRFSWVALLIAVACGLCFGRFMKRAMDKRVETFIAQRSMASAPTPSTNDELAV